MKGAKKPCALAADAHQDIASTSIDTRTPRRAPQLSESMA